MLRISADPTTGLINESGGVSDIVVPNNLVSPTATTHFDLGMNLDASAATGSTFSPRFKFLIPMEHRTTQRCRW
jgi:hypothetical protein